MALLVFCACTRAEQVQPVFSISEQGTLEYTLGERGDRVPDFSSAGYEGGGVAFPNVQAKVVVSPVEGDNTERIQSALDYVASLERDERGLRGAVELAPGRFEIWGQLRLRASGVVLRGLGQGDERATLVATGVDRRDLIRVGGAPNERFSEMGSVVVDEYVPVGATSLTLAPGHGLAVGDVVRIERMGNQKWIETVGMDKAPARLPYQWRPDTILLRWDRRVLAVDGDRVRLDGPLASSLQPEHGQALVRKRLETRALQQVGILDLQCVSEYERGNPADESHSWVAVSVDGVENGWISGVTTRGFALSAVRLGDDARRVTVQDCAYLEPVSERGGYRRQAFHTSGQQTLFLRCLAEDGLDDFTVGHLASGPNVFLECRSVRSGGISGSIGHWATGILFDNTHIDGGQIAFDNRETWNQGVGWAAANSVVYQSSAAIITSRRPPTAQNWAIGVWSQYEGDGAWIQVSQFVNPKSLYRAQLAERLGQSALRALEPYRYLSDRKAVPTLKQLGLVSREERAAAQLTLQQRDGWLLLNDTLATGKAANVTWWRGDLLPTRSAQFGYGLTRFTPGRHGPGATEDLEQLTDAMIAAGQVSLRHNYGLWYDRRRDDHQMTRRFSGDVWPPFYEQPFVRSGKGTAWDGLSKYDLSRYNPWYFARLKQFALLAEQKGLVLINEMYFQHNIIESGAHWVDSPWRPVNAVQSTGFDEPPPFKGDTIKMADAFYDIEHPERRKLHRAYIRQCLHNLADAPNALHTISAEYTGPLHFMEFWLDVIAEWEAETGKSPLIVLSCTKDVQDAILADPQRAGLIDVIEFQYWWYSDDGAFEPLGGISLAPRQNQRLHKGGKLSGNSLARMASEYRMRFPDKAVISALGIADSWAFLAAGGSFAALPATTDTELLRALPGMRPLQAGKDYWILGDADGQGFAYVASKLAPDVFATRKPGFELLSVDTETGRLSPSSGSGQLVYFLRRTDNP